MLRSASGSGPIVLAQEPPFRLGGLWVEPGFRQVSGPDFSQTLEPRVMQGLVALAQADGGIVGRDLLIERCWSGRIVGENAINRVISLLRHLASDSKAFEIETITKVGYRLKVLDVIDAAPTATAPAAMPEARIVGRRAALATLGVVSLGGITYLAATERLSPRRWRAERFYRSGIDSERRGDAGIRQAIADYQRAVDADPNFAPAWGALARALVSLAGDSYGDALEPVSLRALAAADRALRLDPRNADALVAQILVPPLYRNWQALDSRARTMLAVRPELATVRARLARCLSDTGRNREALALMRQVIAQEPLIPAHQVRLAWLRWQTGDVTGARQTLERAQKAWPIGYAVWTPLVLLLILSGAGEDALRVIRSDSRTTLSGPLPPTLAETCALALTPGADDAARAKAVLAIAEGRRSGDLASFVSIQLLPAFGALDLAYAHAWSYYFGKHDSVTGERRPLGRFEERVTDILFSSAAAPMRADPRFPRLTAAIGLDDYWRITRSRAD